MGGLVTETTGLDTTVSTSPEPPSNAGLVVAALVGLALLLRRES